MGWLSFFFFFSSRRRHTRFDCDWSSDVCSSDLITSDDPARLELERELSNSLWTVGELARAEALLNGLIEAAAAAGDRRQEWYGLLDRSARGSFSDYEAADELLSLAE